MSARNEVEHEARLGITQDFLPGEHERVEQVLADLTRLGVGRLRTKVSWARWETPEGTAWYTWLFTRCARDVEVVPVLCDLPSHLSWDARAEAFGAFVASFLERVGRHVTWIQLWEDPRNLESWNWRADPGHARFIVMISQGAQKVRAAGKKVVIPCTVPVDAAFTADLLKRGLATHTDAVCVHAIPDLTETGWEGWPTLMENVLGTLRKTAPGVALWINAGYSAWREDERRQLCEFLEVVKTPASRVFWMSARDSAPTDSSVEAESLSGTTISDPRTNSLGLRREDGTPRLLMRLWQEHGLSQLEPLRELTQTRPLRKARAEKHTVIFGGAGFIGSNVANALLEQGRRVLVVDSLGRRNVEKNLRWLCERHPERLGVRVGDIRDAKLVRQAVENASEVFHFAAQVAVTTSLEDPVNDFEVNARGTLNVLEAARAQAEPPSILFTSTNKVYGGLQDIPLREVGGRYEPESEALRHFGISERRGVEFESPYGCSKGAADQYVLDYSHSFGLKTVVFRMSCIYGPRQFGNEDQGWVAHFLIRALEGKPITLYGDGKQVRDILFVEDLVRAMRTAMDRIDDVKGQAFNIGGGPQRTVSLLELLQRMETLTGRRPDLRFEDWRTGDQRYYVSDIRKFESATGWRPQVTVEEGTRRLCGWLEETLFDGRAPSPREPEVVEAAHAL